MAITIRNIQQVEDDINSKINEIKINNRETSPQENSLIFYISTAKDNKLEGFQLSYNFAGHLNEDEKISTRISTNDVFDITQQVKNSNPKSEDLDEYVESVIQKSDHDSIFNATIGEAKDRLSLKAPIYRDLLEVVRFMHSGTKTGSSSVPENDDQQDSNEPGAKKPSKEEVGTLAVGWSDVIKDYIMYYNTEFILRAAVKEYFYHGSKYTSFRDCYIYLLSFFLVHEMSHILRHHLSNKENALQGIGGQFVNITGDMYINMQISELLADYKGVRGKVYPSVGIMKEDIIKGKYTDDNVGISSTELAEMITNIISSYADIDVRYNATSFNANINLGEEGIIKILYPSNLDFLFKGNSTQFIKFCHRLLNDIFKKPERPAQQQGGQGEGQQGGQSQQGDQQQGQSSDSQSGQDQQGDQQQGQQGQSQPGQGQQGGEQDPRQQDSQQGDSQDDQQGQSGQQGGEEGDQQGDQQDDSSGGQQGDQQDQSGQSGSGGDDSSSGDSEIDGSSTGDEESIIDRLAREINDSQNDEHKRKSDDEVNKGINDNSDPTSNKSQMDKESLDKIKDSLRDIVQKNQGKGNDTELEKLGNMGLDKLTGLNANAKRGWRKQLNSMMRKVMNLDVKYDANVPSARIEGQLGREVDIKKIKNVVLAIDVSPSMGPQKFKEVLQHIVTMLKVSKFSGAKFHVVFWGSSDNVDHYVYRSPQGLYKKILSMAKMHTATDITPSIEYILKKVRKPDIVIYFTDGELNGPDPESYQVNSYRRLMKRVIWVVTRDGRISEIQKFDNLARRKMIKQDR